MLARRTLMTATAAAALVPAAPAILRADDMPGVTPTEIRIGNTVPYSGPANAFGAIGKACAATFSMINGTGGIGGRKIRFISYDDHYSPPKTVELIRRLIEVDNVACLCATLGSPTNTAVVKYVNQQKVPQLFVASGADKWGDYKEHPWTIGWQPSYVAEAQIYAKYIMREKPDAKIGILYQNDVFGADYLTGVKDVLRDRFDAIVTEAPFDVADTTINSQLARLQAADVTALMTVATPKIAAQTIRRLAEMRWRPLHVLTSVSASVGTVMLPAGAANGVGIISSGYLKDPTDPRWDDDAGMRDWRAFMAKYDRDGNVKDVSNVFGYGIGLTMLQVLRACGDDLSRENIMKQAANLRDFEIPILLPGIRINTSPTNYHPIRQFQLMRWNGKAWDHFGELVDGAST